MEENGSQLDAVVLLFFRIHLLNWIVSEPLGFSLSIVCCLCGLSVYVCVYIRDILHLLALV